MGKGKKKAKYNSFEVSSKDPVVTQGSDSYYGQTPVWSFSRCDFDHEKWGICNHTDCVNDLLRRLNSFERSTWGDIFMDTAGRRSNTKNHAIETSRIIKEAQQRLSDINLDDFDTLHSLTITGKQRLWGVMVSGVFCVVWLDRAHEICPSCKRGT